MSASTNLRLSAVSAFTMSDQAHSIRPLVTALPTRSTSRTCKIVASELAGGSGADSRFAPGRAAVSGAIGAEVEVSFGSIGGRSKWESAAIAGAVVVDSGE